MIGYDDYGYQSSLEDIDAGTIEYTYNAFGELESQTDAKGNEQTLTYDAMGRALTKSWNGGEEITYVYNPVNRMIKSISSSNGTRKSFEYDELNRLLTYTAGQDTLSVSYDGSGYGNITGKTDVGTYDYTGGVHKVTSVTNPTVLMQNRPKQHIEYTKFNKVGYIRDSLNTGAERELFITYGPDQQRVKTLYKEDGIDVKTEYFALGQYEKETDSTGYDQVIAMFLSPYNFVQSPDLTQNFNRYTYCLNNPLKFTDPSGNNYMQLLDMAYEGNPIKNYGGGTWWGNDLQIPYPEDFIGIDGGIYASLSAPGSNYQKWISSPSLQNKYSSFEDYNSAQGYYVYVDHGGEVTNEKYIINTNGGYIEITLPTIDIITEKIWISTSDTGLSVGGGNGFNVADNILGGAGLINGLAGFDAGLSSKHTYRYAQKVNGKIVSAAELTAQNQAKALKILNASKSFATKLNVASVIVITGDVLYNSQITASQGLNAFMTGIAFTGWGAPVAGLWFVADFGTGLFTGRSLSDRLNSRAGAPLVDWDW